MEREKVTRPIEDFTVVWVNILKAKIDEKKKIQEII